MTKAPGWVCQVVRYFDAAETPAGGRASSGNSRARHSVIPPASGRTLVIPRFRSIKAMRAAVTSFGQAQKRITS